MSRAHGLSWIKRSIQSGFVHGLSPFAATLLKQTLTFLSLFGKQFISSTKNVDVSFNTSFVLTNMIRNQF